MATKISRGDYVHDTYPCAKLHYDPIRGFCPCICEVSYQNIHSVSFLGVLPTRYLLGHCADFHDRYVKRRRFAQGCSFLGLQN